MKSDFRFRIPRANTQDETLEKLKEVLNEHGLNGADYHPSKSKINQVREEQERNETLEGIDEKAIIGDPNRRTTRSRQVKYSFAPQIEGLSDSEGETDSGGSASEKSDEE